MITESHQTSYWQLNYTLLVPEIENLIGIETFKNTRFPLMFGGGYFSKLFKLACQTDVRPQ